DINSYLTLIGNECFAAKAEHSRHPDEFVQEFVEAIPVGRISDLACSRIKKFSDVAEIDVRKNRDHSEFAQHRKKILYHARAAEWARGHTANPGGLMDVFLQVRVEHMLQQTRKTVVILRDNEDERVGVVHRL